MMAGVVSAVGTGAPAARTTSEPKRLWGSIS